MRTSFATLSFVGFYGSSLAAAFPDLWIGAHRYPSHSNLDLWLVREARPQHCGQLIDRKRVHAEADLIFKKRAFSIL